MDDSETSGSPRAEARWSSGTPQRPFDALPRRPVLAFGVAHFAGLGNEVAPVNWSKGVGACHIAILHFGWWGLSLWEADAPGSSRESSAIDVFLGGRVFCGAWLF